MTLGKEDNHWIFAHRGQWSNVEEQNSVASIDRAFMNGFSVETDIRERMGKLIISHDLPSARETPTDLQMESKGRFALNIKEDGLFTFFEQLRETIVSTSSFLFDGSIPQMYGIRKIGLPHALRLSEFEKDLPWKSEYLWIDGFETNWWMYQPKIYSLIENYNCIFVSPELHKREYGEAFDWFAETRVNKKFNISVCTDYPQNLLEHCNGQL
jgi:hypothetical protein